MLGKITCLMMNKSMISTLKSLKSTNPTLIKFSKAMKFADICSFLPHLTVSGFITLYNQDWLPDFASCQFFHASSQNQSFFFFVSEKLSTHSRWMWKQPSSVTLCTYSILHGEAQSLYCRHESKDTFWAMHRLLSFETMMFCEACRQFYCVILTNLFIAA